MRRFMLLLFVTVALASFMASGCAGLTPTQQRALTGGAVGAAAGAAIGAMAGNAAVGAAIGGPTGAAAGALWRDIAGRAQ